VGGGGAAESERAGERAAVFLPAGSAGVRGVVASVAGKGIMLTGFRVRSRTERRGSAVPDKGRATKDGGTAGGEARG
jgi:hypothetical protein